MTRLGLISDTHGLLRPEVFGHLAGVDRILHAGDVGGASLLVELETLAPVTAVVGNTDGFELAERLPEEAWVEAEGRRILVVHGHLHGVPTPRRLRAAYPGADIIVFGHTHRAEIDRAGRSLVVNPGAAGPARFRVKPSLAVLELAEGGEPAVRLIPL